MKNKLLSLILTICFCLPIFAEAAYSSLTSGISQLSLMKKYKSVNLITHNKLKKSCIRLTQEDKYVIIKYVMGAVKGEDSFLLTNCYLRNNLDKYINKRDITKPLQCRLKFYADSLSHTVSKVKLPQNVILYYGMEDKDATAVFAGKGIENIISSPISDENLIVLKNKLQNKEYTEKGFMLTSYDRNNIKKTKIRLTINAPKNLQAMLIDEIISKDNKQILINAGYKWKITDVEILTDNHTKFYSITTKLVL